MKVYYQIKSGGDQPNSFWGSQLLQFTFIITSFGHFTHGQLAMCYYTPKELYNVHSFCHQYKHTHTGHRPHLHKAIGLTLAFKAIGLTHSGFSSQIRYKPSATTYQAIGLLHHLHHIFSRYCRPYCLIQFVIFCLRVYFYVTVCSVT